MTKNEIMDYVTETPHNINKNILGQKLDQYASQSGGGGVFVVRAAGYANSDVEIDKTFDEILTAVNSGAVVVADWCVGDSFEADTHRSFTTVFVNSSYVSFTNVEYSNGMGMNDSSLYYQQLYIKPNGTAHIYMEQSILSN